MRISAVKVLLVDDTPQLYAALKTAMAADPAVRLEGMTDTIKEARKLIKTLKPDIVVVNTNLESVDAGAMVRELSALFSLPVIVIGPNPSRPGEEDYLQLPDFQEKSSLMTFCNELCVKIKMSGRPGRTGVPAAVLPESGGMRCHVIVIGASTGGTEATAEIMKKLPKGLPGIVIVQHMPPGFTEMYARRLDGISEVKVSEAKDGDRVLPGTALVAPGGKQLRLMRDANGGYYVRCMPGDKVNGHCPSVGVLFDSAASAAGPDAIGVILTGMGSDGAHGLLHMREKGAFTIGQDSESSVVYGMPMEAQKLGAVLRQAPISAIASILIEAVKSKS